MLFFQTHNEHSQYLLQFPNFKTVCLASQESQVPPVYQVKKWSKWIIWGGITRCGPPGSHFISKGLILTANYCMRNLLEKEEKSILHRKIMNQAPDGQKLFSSNGHLTLVHDRAPAHAAKTPKHGAIETSQILCQTQANL